MSDLAGAFIVVSLIAFVVVGLLYVLRRPISAGWRAFRALNLRRVVLVAALLTIAWLGAYPPWSYTFSAPQASQVVKAGPRAFILAPPPTERTGASNGITVDLSRLLIEWIVVGAIAAALTGLLPRPQSGSRALAPAEADNDGTEAAPSEVDEADTHEPPPSPGESAASLHRDDPDDPVAWSNPTGGKATTRPEEHREFPKISEALGAAEGSPQPGTKPPSRRLKNGMTLDEFADALANGMATNLRKRTLDEAANAPRPSPSPKK